MIYQLLVLTTTRAGYGNSGVACATQALGFAEKLDADVAFDQITGDKAVKQHSYTTVTVTKLYAP